MYNKTFKTMDKYPLVFLIAIPTVIIKLIYQISSAYSAEYLINNFILAGKEFSLFKKENVLFVLFNFLIVGTILLLIYPSVLNYIYNACNNNVKKGWYKLGFKRNSLKMFPLYIIAWITTALALAILFIMLFNSNTPFDNIVMLPIVFFASIIMVNIQIGTVAVVVEKSVRECFVAFFKYFFEIFFPLYGTIILFGIPSKLLDNSFKIGFIPPTELFYNISNLSTSYSSNKILFSIIVLVFSILVEIFITTFIYTYLNHKYIAIKDEYIENQNKQSNLPQIEKTA